ncbi:hypothetical protein GCM10022628_24110 [Anoxybacillus suryakundensis]
MQKNKSKDNDKNSNGTLYNCYIHIRFDKVIYHSSKDESENKKNEKAKAH